MSESTMRKNFRLELRVRARFVYYINVKYRYVWARSCDKRSESKLNHTHAQISVPSEIADSADQLFVIKTLPGNQ